MFIIVPEQRFARISFSNSGSREKNIENVFFEPVWRRKLFQMKVWVAAINSIKFSSKSELTSRFFSRLKFRFFFETSNGRLPLEISSDRPQTLPKRVSDDPRRFIFRRQKQIFGEIFGSKFHFFATLARFCVYTQHTRVLCIYTTHMYVVYSTASRCWFQQWDCGCAASRCWFQQWDAVALHPVVDFNNGLRLRCIPLLISTMGWGCAASRCWFSAEQAQQPRNDNKNLRSNNADCQMLSLICKSS